MIGHVRVGVAVGVLAAGLTLAASASGASRTGSAADVAIVTDEADAALTLLHQLRRSESPAPGDWDRLFATEGYRRLARRELKFQRAFSDSAFRAFLTTPSVAARAPALERTLAEWRQADVGAAARRALRYLPEGASLRARMYFAIKPRTNSFVFFEDSLPPAIFMYLDPAVPRPKLENTLAHELHHIGLRAACEGQADTTRPARVRTALDWIGAFGEGRAMLAAVGGAAVHPHAASPDSERTRWDRDLRNAEADVRKLERFFGDILDGRLATEDTITTVGMSFFGEQGPWYTVGWLMASTIERELGRGVLVASACDPAQFLRDYDSAARQARAAGDAAPPLWSEALLARLAP